MLNGMLVRLEGDRNGSLLGFRKAGTNSRNSKTSFMVDIALDRVSARSVGELDSANKVALNGFILLGLVVFSLDDEFISFDVNLEFFRLESRSVDLVVEVSVGLDGQTSSMVSQAEFLGVVVEEGVQQVKSEGVVVAVDTEWIPESKRHLGTSSRGK